MRIVSLTLPVLVLLVALKLTDDSPHGSDFEVSCSVCHSPIGWELDMEIYSFDHNTTNLPLLGQHVSISCRLCHPSLVFSDAGTNCIDCHTDMHNQTVGHDCGRCHNPESWIVNNITDIHRFGRFPLLGAHVMADCEDCHPSASLLRFEPLRIECFDCHMEDYVATTDPNHVLGNISTDCIECHLMDAFTWSGGGFTHFFFPLNEGHAISDCNRCHTGNDFSDISSDCISCHQPDYTATTNPDHVTTGLPTDCQLCHTTLPGWTPADFRIHDAQYFPIYSGRHRDEWTTCADCHTNTGNYAVFSCIDCHEHNRTDMDDKHSGEADYLYNSISCLECHPSGEHE